MGIGPRTLARSLAPAAALVASAIGAAATAENDQAPGERVSGDAARSYDVHQRTLALAFDPDRFFAGPTAPYMALRYTADDHDYPVYAIAVRQGCTTDDGGAPERICGSRLTARMVRISTGGDGNINARSPRAHSLALLAALRSHAVNDDAALTTGLTNEGLEWLEADVSACAPAAAHLATAIDTPFFATDPRPQVQEFSIVLHADKMAFAYGGYLKRTRYDGWMGEGTPGAWAHEFARSLEGCWRPAEAEVPWMPPA